jgi:hypothetical protein
MIATIRCSHRKDDSRSLRVAGKDGTVPEQIGMSRKRATHDLASSSHQEESHNRDFWLVREDVFSPLHGGLQNF